MKRRKNKRLKSGDLPVLLKGGMHRIIESGSVKRGVCLETCDWICSVLGGGRHDISPAPAEYICRSALYHFVHFSRI